MDEKKKENHREEHFLKKKMYDVTLTLDPKDLDDVKKGEALSAG